MNKPLLNWTTDAIVNIYDDTPFWSAPFGSLLLENIPMRGVNSIIDIGHGTGFPLIELAQRFGEEATIIGVDPWEMAYIRTKKKASLLELNNLTLINDCFENISIKTSSMDLICSNLGVNNFTNKQKAYQLVFNALRTKGHFCITTNHQQTFEELFFLFHNVFKEMKLDTQSLSNYINARSSSQQTIKEIEGVGFQLVKEIEDSTSLRFASTDAIFDHSIIRIAFRETWEKLVGKKNLSAFYQKVKQAIQSQISHAGEFKLTIPITYLHFQKIK